MLRFFDQIRFYPVTAEELLQHRKDFLTGKFQIRVEEETFRIKDYQVFLDRNSASIDTFRSTQRAAFSEERERWEAAGQLVQPAELAIVEMPAIELPPGGFLVSAHLPGSVWQLLVKEGDQVCEGDNLLILESMKMETAVTSPMAGTVERILCGPGTLVDVGQALMVVVL